MVESNNKFLNGSTNHSDFINVLAEEKCRVKNFSGISKFLSRKWIIETIMTENEFHIMMFSDLDKI